MADIFDLFKQIAGKEEAPKEPITWLIVGLGNPGDKYRLTRHNAGFLTIDYLAERCGVRIDRAKFHALCAEATVGSHRVLLMKPSTLMNNSGVAIGEAAAFYRIPPERVIVLHDEISFEPGVIRIRRKGSAGGHNGLKSVIACLASEEFPRIKIGVGKKPTPEYDLVDWVLGRLPEEGLAAIAARYEDIRSAVEMMLSGKIDEAMNKYSK